MNPETQLPERDGETDTPRSSLAATLMEWAAVLLIGSVTLLVLVNALSRYFLSRPLPWTEELVVNLMVWLGAVGMVLATMRGMLICCDILTMRLSPTKARVLAVSGALFSAMVMAIFAWLTWRYLQMFGGDLTPILRIPKAVVILAVLFTAIGTSIALISSLIPRQPSGLRGTD
jgi:TRAP-type C4-dicarboxylate transport system permease small subunit